MTQPKPSIYDTSFADVQDILFSWNQRFDQEYPFYKKLLEKYKPNKVVDIGCGDGFHLYLISKCNPGLDLTGIDISRAMLKKAKRNLLSKNVKATLAKADLKNLSFLSKNKFDLIICNFTLSAFHPGEGSRTEKLQYALKKIKALLSKKGILVIQDLNGKKIQLEPNQTLTKKQNKKRYVLFKRGNIRCFISKSNNKLITVAKKRNGFQIGIKSNFIYKILNNRNIYLRTNYALDQLTLHNHVLINQGFLKRIDIKQYWSTNWFVTKPVLKSELKKAGLLNHYFLGDNYSPKTTNHDYSFTAVIKI